jgi:stress response protein YsnF
MTLSEPNNSDANKHRHHEEKRRRREAESRQSELLKCQPGSVEFSAPLENSVPLEAPQVEYFVVPDPIVSASPATTSTKIKQLSETAQPTPQPVPQAPESKPPIDESAPTKIQLLDERVVVNQRRKTSEVVVRKEIETHVVEVPIRREKLVVEQVSPEYKQLAVIELGQPQVKEFNALGVDHTTLALPVSGNFTSINTAIQFLQAIAAEPDLGLQQVQLSVVLTDPASKAACQHLLEQHLTPPGFRQ